MKKSFTYATLLGIYFLFAGTILVYGQNEDTEPVSSNFQLEDEIPLHIDYNTFALAAMDINDFTQSLDSTIKTHINPETSEELTRQKTSYKYNTVGQKIEEIKYIRFPNSDILSPTKKTNWNWNSDEMLTQKTNFWFNPTSGNWALQSEEILTYNENGILNNYARLKYNSEGSIFHKWEGTYNEYGNLTTKINSFWDNETQSFIPKMKVDFSYNELNLIDIEEMFVYKAPSQTWLPKAIKNYNYDEQEREVLLTESFWKPNHDEAIPFLKTTTSYSENSFELYAETEILRPMQEEWLLIKKETLHKSESELPLYKKVELKKKHSDEWTGFEENWTYENDILHNYAKTKLTGENIHTKTWTYDSAANLSEFISLNNKMDNTGNGGNCGNNNNNNNSGNGNGGNCGNGNHGNGGNEGNCGNGGNCGHGNQGKNANIKITDIEYDLNILAQDLALPWNENAIYFHCTNKVLKSNHYKAFNNDGNWEFTLSGSETFFYSLLREGQVGISENNRNDSNIYPNPANNFIYISTNNTNDQSFSLMDLHGRQIMEMKVNQSSKIDLSHLNAGIYIYRLGGQKSNITNKLIIK